MNNIVIPSGTKRETWFLLEFIALYSLPLKQVKQSNPWRLKSFYL
jgi:hypothetical protein